MVNDKYFLDLVTQTPINYSGLILYQPTFAEIKEIGIDVYNQIMQVYSLTLECFEDVQKDKHINLFDDVFLNDDFLISCLGESLYILTKADEIILDRKSKSLQLKFIDIQDVNSTNNSKKNKVLFVCCNLFSKMFRNKIKPVKVKKKEEKKESIFIINSNNFDELSEIILKINSNKKVEIEKPPENMSARQRDVWQKLQEGRRNDSKKNEVHIYDVLNICEYGGNYHIPIEEIMKWSLWRITNCYKARVGWKNYDDNLQIALVSGDSKNISGENHWHYQLMIRE